MLKNENEIRAEIDKLNQAIDGAGYKPIPSGERLEHDLYMRRIAAIDYLNWVLNEEQPVVV